MTAICTFEGCDLPATHVDHGFRPYIPGFAAPRAGQPDAEGRWWREGAMVVESASQDDEDQHFVGDAATDDDAQRIVDWHNAALRAAPLDSLDAALTIIERTAKVGCVRVHWGFRKCVDNPGYAPDERCAPCQAEVYLAARLSAVSGTEEEGVPPFESSIEALPTATAQLDSERRKCPDCKNSMTGLCIWHAGYEAGIRARAIQEGGAG